MQSAIAENRAPDGVTMDMADVERSLSAWAAQGRSGESQNIYRRGLRALYDFLPEDKTIRPGTIEQWRDRMLENGYSNSTVNGMLAAANQFLDFMGHRELQFMDRLKVARSPQPELTRGEYLRMLAAAKSRGNEKLYLLVKVFACTGIYSQSLPMVTVENVRKGRFSVTYMGSQNIFRIPACLQKELLSFAETQGIKTGPIFLTKLGTTPSHTYISHSIANLCVLANVPEEKGSPRCLRKLYYTTRAEIEASFEPLIEQTMDRQLEQEQVTLGWEVD